MSTLKKTTTTANWTVGEFFHLIWINIIVRIRDMIDFIKTVFKYYSKWSFLKVDLSLLLMYLFRSPYAISKRFLKEKGEEDIYAYGETPLSTIDLIAKECRISKDDIVFEIGSGRGRTCFWLNSFIGCRVVGIEFIPEFVSYANRIKDKLEITGIEFRLEDILKANYSRATVCYLYGTCLPAKSIEKLIAKFSLLSVGTQIITVSYPLTDYAGGERFEVLKRFPASFTWGVGDVYLHAFKG